MLWLVYSKVGIELTFPAFEKRIISYDLLIKYFNNGALPFLSFLIL